MAVTPSWQQMSRDQCLPIALYGAGQCGDVWAIPTHEHPKPNLRSSSGTAGTATQNHVGSLPRWHHILICVDGPAFSLKC
eukprot:scaffold74108_cov20-Tisochrysis_lutea.AAC.1